MLGAVLAFVRGWAGFVGLVLLDRILQTTVSVVYERVRKRVDDALPDDLPLTAGQWLEEQIRTRQLSTRVVIDPKGEDTAVDAYLPQARTIILSSRCYYAMDPSYWGAAAHELGHALVHRSASVVGAVLVTARLVSSSLAQVAVLVIFGNILYGSGALDRLAFQLLETSLAAFGLVLLDETAASLVALKLLTSDGRVNGRGMMGVFVRLAAGFTTYLGAFGGRLFLILQSELVMTKIEQHRHFVPTSGMGDARFISVSLLAIFLVTMSIVAIVRSFRPPSATIKAARIAEGRRKLMELARSALAMLVILLVWDQELGPIFWFGCVGAIVASRPVIVLATALATTILRIPLFVVTELFAPPSDDDGSAPLEQGAYDEMELGLLNDPPLATRLGRVAFPALHLAFVVLFYVLLVRGR
jgi:Zn-dependent membrane protease YugP